MLFLVFMGKYFIFYLFLIIGTPLLTWAGLRFSLFKRLLIALFIFTPFIITSTSIHFYSMATYRGTSRGFEFGLVDLLGLVLWLIYLFSKPSTDKKEPFLPYNSIFFFGLIGVGLLSVIWNTPKIMGFFDLCLWLRMAMYYYVFTRHIRTLKDINLVLLVLCGAIWFEFFNCIYDRYILSIWRISGTFGHPNNLGFAMNLLIGPLFAVVIENIIPKFKLFFISSLLAAVLMLIFSISRGSITGGLLIIGIITIASIFNRMSWKKFSIIVGFFVLTLLMFIKASDSLMARFNLEKVDQTRVEFNDYAIKLWTEHPVLGIGLNNFPYYANRFEDQNFPPAHNIYFLMLAETGILGLFVYLIYYFRFLWIGIYSLFKMKGKHPHTQMLKAVTFGATISIFIAAIQLCMEYIWRLSVIMYIVFIITSLIVVSLRCYQNQGKQS